MSPEYITCASWASSECSYPITRLLGHSDAHILGFPRQTTGVDLVVKTVPVPDTGDSVVSGALDPRELSALPAGPRVSMVSILPAKRDAVQGLGLGSSEHLGRVTDTGQRIGRKNWGYGPCPHRTDIVSGS